MIWKVLSILSVLIFGPVLSVSVPTWTALYKPHIIGGEAADIKDFPYQVSLRKRGEYYGHGHICGASVMDELHVLTAAHCVSRPSIPDLYYIVANSTKLDGGRPTVFEVERVDHHENWRPTNHFQFDVAVIKLRDSLVFTESDNIKAIPLVPVGEEPSAGSKAVVAGWGRTIPGNKRPELDYSDLMRLDLQVVDRTDCDKCLGGTGKITSKLICAGLDGEQKKDASVGDSGGPLVDSKTGMQIGIVSFGDESPSSSCPGAYTNLADKDVRQFIDKALER